ncbi:MAG: biopolymer transporter ExbD [Candidatus Omnitrophota bacterium]
MKFKRYADYQKDWLDIAPLIDVVFLLLIFFMLTSSFISQPGIKINLPKALTSKAIQEDNLVIAISAQDSILIQNQAVSLEQLKSQLQKAAKQNRPLLIKADCKASMGKTVQVWDMCRQIGLNQVNIATNQIVQ